MKANKIVYTSNTGFTERYARMLAEETGLPCYRLEESPRGGSAIYLGWLMAGRIKGLDKAKKKHLVTACCAVGLGETGQMEQIAAQLPGGKVFYLRGGYIHEKQRGLNRLLMSIMGKAMEKKPPEDEAAQSMARAVREGADYVSREQLEPVVAWLDGSAPQ